MKIKRVHEYLALLGVYADNEDNEELYEQIGDQLDKLWYAMTPEELEALQKATRKASRPLKRALL